MRDNCKVRLPALGLLLALLAGCRTSEPKSAGFQSRSDRVRGAFGSYDGEPRRPDGRVDVDRLVSELDTIHAHCYNFLVWHAATDWDDLKLLLPLARAKNIKIWITLVPPSESPPRTKRFSEPFRLDYERWAAEIARLSVQEPNLAAWSVDDFSANTKVFTPERLEKILEGARAINPKLAFVPCCYYRQVTPEFAQKYRPLLDGVLFPYRHESGKMDLTDASAVPTEVARLRELLGPAMPIIVDVYATRHARLGDSSPEYVEQVMEAGKRQADGVLIYCHQNEAASPEKYRVIKRQFAQWAGGAWR